MRADPGSVKADTGRDLRGMRCSPKPPALAAGEVRGMLKRVDGWRVRKGGIEKTCAFASGWLETIAFVNAVAWLCQREDHHPDLDVGYDRCTIRFSTHSAGGLTMNDFICAGLVDALVATGR